VYRSDFVPERTKVGFKKSCGAALQLLMHSAGGLLTAAITPANYALLPAAIPEASLNSAQAWLSCDRCNKWRRVTHEYMDSVLAREGKLWHCDDADSPLRKINPR
jgi:CW-type Zinc Finger